MMVELIKPLVEKEKFKIGKYELFFLLVIILKILQKKI